MTDKTPTDIATIPRHDAPEATRRFASSASFFSVKAKVVTEDVYFPEKAFWLRFKAITQAEYRQALTFYAAYDPQTRQRTPEKDKDLNVVLFIACAVDNDGHRVFDTDDYKRLLAEPASLISRGMTVINKLVGTSETAAEKDKRKNFFDETGDDDES